MAVTSSRLSTPHEPWANEKKTRCDKKHYSTSAASEGQGAEAGKGSSSPELLRRKRKGEQQRCGTGQWQAGWSQGGARGALSMGTPGTAASQQRQGKACCSTPTTVLTGKGTVVSHSGQEFGPKGKKGGLNSTNAQCIWKLIELYGTDNFVNIKLTKKILFFPSLLNRTIWFCCFTCLNFVPTS